MHHPGPPRFAAVGDHVELAPRDPDPDATYRWHVDRSPADSSATVGDGPVEHLAVDAAGTYVCVLEAPDGPHALTVRAFERASGTGETRAVGASGHEAGYTADDELDAVAAADGGRPRVTLSGEVRDEAVVIEATPLPNPDGDETAADLDVEFVLDDRDPITADEVRVDGRRLVIPENSLDDRVRVHAVAVGDGGHSVADHVDVRPTGDDVTLRYPYHPPAWSTDAIYYEVYVRTFADGSEYDSQFDAIADKLDHLERLGVDAIWLTPVLQNDHAPHGYNITDFFAIAEDLGDREAFERFVAEVHERDMRVLFDLVINHSARDHPYFQDAYGDPDSAYRDWYEWQESGEPGTYFDWEYIANFDFDTLDVRRHLLDAVDAWSPLVDGFRCDMAWAVPNGFWREIHDRVKARDSEFLLLDETIPYIADFQEGLFDVHFDSTTYAALRSVGTGYEPPERVLDAIDGRASLGFPPHAGFLLYAENHDETRYRVECGEPEAMGAAGALATLPGAPLVYAGQELGQLGKRDDVVWDATDEALLGLYRRVLAARSRLAPLQAAADLVRIDREVREGWDDRVLAFARVAPDAGDESLAALRDRVDAADGVPDDCPAAVVLVNFGEGTARVDPGPDAVRVDAVTEEGVAADGVAVDSVVVLPTVPDALP